jgi:hypothetical protein
MKYLIIISSILVFYSCNKDQVQLASEAESYEVDIRIENESGSDFESVYINTSGGSFNYGDILSGDTTNYVHFDFAYNYAYVELLVNGDTLIIQPIDYVGEEKLSEGLYTYQLDLLPLGINNDTSLVMSTVSE